MSGRTGLSARCSVGTRRRARARRRHRAARAVRRRAAAAAATCTSAARCCPTSTAANGARCSRAFTRTRRAGARLRGARRAGALRSHARADNRPWLLALDAAPSAPRVTRASTSRMTQRPAMGREPPGHATCCATAPRAYASFRHGPREPRRGAAGLPRAAAGLQPAHARAGGRSCAATRAGRAPTRGLVQAALRRLRTGGYSYTLEPGCLRRRTRPTSSGSTARPASASTSPRPSSC